GTRRVLLPRSAVADTQRRADDLAACVGARRTRRRRARPFSAVGGGAGHHRHRVERTIRPVRTTRCARDDAGAAQLVVWDTGIAMNRLAALFVLLAALALGSCSKTDNSHQGWIEANLIFVGPDEVGRVQTLSVREGDVVKSGQPLFTVDDDLQQADL